jgi:hypothetical protein
METRWKLPKAPVRTSLGFVFSLLDRAITDSLSARKFGRAEMYRS